MNNNNKILLEARRVDYMYDYINLDASHTQMYISVYTQRLQKLIYPYLFREDFPLLFRTWREIFTKQPADKYS